MIFPADDGPGTPMRAAMACVERDGLVLLQERLRRGRRVTEFPGGSCDRGEPFADAARRELREETGLVIDASPLETRIVTTAAGAEIAFCRLPCPPDAAPRETDARRRQRFLWTTWADLPWEDLLAADRAFVALQRHRSAPDAPLPDALLDALVEAAAGEADEEELRLWLDPVLARWPRPRLRQRLDRGVDESTGRRAGDFARLRRMARGL